MDNVKAAAAAEQAYATIVTELAGPHYFEKLAAHGVAPRSADEAAEMWAIGHKLHALYTADQEKAAAAQVSGLAAANQQLDYALAAAGLAAPAEKAAAFRGAADVAARQPKIAQAILTLQAVAGMAAQNA